MASPPEPADDHERRFREIVGDYLEAEEAGHPPDRAALLANNPEHAPELRAFFRDHDRVRGLAPPPDNSPPGERATTGHECPGTADPAQDVVRYFGDYEILKTLGEGGMGRVYQARQKSLNRDVALKMMKAGRFATEEDRRRFHIEAEAVAALDHPNIVPIYEVGEHEGQHYFTMKHMDGGSLRERLGDVRLPGGPARAGGATGATRPGAAQARERARKVAAFMVTVARAVHHAHQRGILHRDLKPGNILLADGVPHLTDFGLAKRTDGSQPESQSGAIVGTLNYMAPEQAGQKKDVTTLADVYGLGAVLYELLTGRAPADGDELVEVFRQVLEEEPPAPRTLNPLVPRDLETICLKCLRKDPKQRYRSAEEVALDLGRYLDGEPIEARPVGILERLWLWCRRHRARVALTLAGAAMLLVLGVGWLWVQEQNAVRQAETHRQARAALEEAAQLHGQAGATGDPEVAALAVKAARRAETLLEGDVGDEARLPQARARREELEQAERRARERDAARKRDRRMLARLEAARRAKVTMKGDHFDSTPGLAAYEDAFREYGIDPDQMTPAEAAARIKASPIRGDLAGALDEWGILSVDVKFKRWTGLLDKGSKVNVERTDWLFQAARADDTDPWRNALRQALTKPNLFTLQKTLTQLARTADVTKVPPPTLATLGECLGAFGAPAEAVAFFRRAHEQHPGDPWLAYWLALYLTQLQPPQWDESLRFAQAAYAAAPTQAVMAFYVGYALGGKADLEGAAKAYRKAIAMRPDFPMAHNNLGNALLSMQAWDEAAVHLREMIRLRPEFSNPHFMLGLIHGWQGRYAEAGASFEKYRKLVSQGHPLRAKADSFLKECEGRLAVQAKLGRIVSGDLQPRDATEAQHFGEVCGFGGYYRASLRCYEIAFAAEAKGATVLEQSRYRAACAAMHLAAGQGKDAAGADAAERARHRGQAVAWLTADLPRFSKVRDSKLPLQRALARQVLLAWKRDPYLAAVRDPVALAALPEAEREACRQLWSEVDTAIKALSQR